MKNKFLKIFKLLLEVFRVIYVVAFALFFAIIIHWHFSPDTYAKVDLSSAYKAGTASTMLKFRADPDDPSVLPMSSLGYSMIWWLALRNFLFFILGLLIIQRLIKVTRSIASLQTFYQGNILHFRIIARLCFILAFAGFFNFYASPDDFRFDLSIPFLPILSGMGSLVLSEIFKEGMLLAQDKELIV